MKGLDLQCGHDYGFGYWLKIFVDKEVFDQSTRLVDKYRGIPVDFEIKKWTEHRSAEANRYVWVLMGKLAAKLGTTKEEVYREHIRDYGVYDIFPVKDIAVERFKDVWESNGYGWICEKHSPCKNYEGYTNMICYYGSSSYNKEEMSVFIDAIVRDCEAQGISTMVPSEIERLKNLWGEWVASQNESTGNQQRG